MPPLNECIHVTHEQVVKFGAGKWVYTQCLICKQTLSHVFYDEKDNPRTLKDMIDDGII